MILRMEGNMSDASQHCCIFPCPESLQAICLLFSLTGMMLCANCNSEKNGTYPPLTMTCNKTYITNVDVIRMPVGTL